MRSNLGALALAAALAGAGPAGAQPTPEARTPIFQGLLDCKAKADPAERLACYDAAVGLLDAAEQKGDIVVVDRDQAQAARRQAFGFNLPSLSMFDRSEAPEKLDQVSAVVQRAYRGGDGKWMVELEGGAVWAQNDSESLFREPRKGSTAEIRKAAMGGYFLNLDGQRAIRARRVR